jgi:ribosomal protein L7Ae-like RNA K-turn-binding protein
MQDRVHTMLGFAKKAGKTVSGEEGLRWHAAAGSACLIVLAEDAREKKVQVVTTIAEKHGIPLLRWGTQASLSQAIGQPVNTAVVVTDRPFAEAILHHLDGREKQ